VSLCGNFGVLRYVDGDISKFNLQSGKDRGLFSCDDEKDNIAKKLQAYKSIHSTRILVSTSLDKTVKLWDFFRGKLINGRDCINKLDIQYQRPEEGITPFTT
jgi:WD40 repeat protein